MHRKFGPSLTLRPHLFRIAAQLAGLHPLHILKPQLMSFQPHADKQPSSEGFNLFRANH